MYYYLSEKQLQDIVSNAISYGTSKLDERYTLLSNLITEIKETQGLEESMEELQTESTKSTLIKDIPSAIKSYTLGNISKDNVSPYLKKFGFNITETADVPTYLVVDWKTKVAVFSTKKNGNPKDMDTFFESLDMIKEGASFRNSASTLLETQAFDWF